jgi:hypothetical protein
MEIRTIRFAVNSQVGWRQKRGDVLLTSEEFAEARSRTTFHNAVVALVSLYLEILNKFTMRERGGGEVRMICACRKEREKRGHL